jgi:hypothetical protein
MRIGISSPQLNDVRNAQAGTVIVPSTPNCDHRCPSSRFKVVSRRHPMRKYLKTRLESLKPALIRRKGHPPPTAVQGLKFKVQGCQPWPSSIIYPHCHSMRKYLKTRLESLKPALNRRNTGGRVLKNRTPNIQHRTLNVTRSASLNIRCSAFSVGCSVFFKLRQVCRLASNRSPARQGSQAFNVTGKITTTNSPSMDYSNLSPKRVKAGQAILYQGPVKPTNAHPQIAARIPQSASCRLDPVTPPEAALIMN